MQRKLSKFFSNSIEFLFYSLFFLVPIVFVGSTSELFEFNKMWLTFGITSLIVFFWISKMIVTKQFRIQRTPLDIPILLFLLSQIISTVLSLDPHVSLWGYYSRFNGGLLSYISYIILYYAFVSNLLRDETKSVASSTNKNFLENLHNNKIVRRLLYVSIASGIFVSLWGLPSHFGYDPTCKLFRGSLDVACWTNDFQPKVRIFSTMGQPDWLAAYLAILIPLSLSFSLKFFDKAKSLLSKNNLLSAFFALTTVLFYVDLLFTRARSGFIAIAISLLVFILLLIVKNFKDRENFRRSILPRIAGILICFGIISFVLGTSVGPIDNFSLQSLRDRFSKHQVTSTTASNIRSAGELGGTDSAKIRLIVWKGALDIWKNNPIFGTGVETFAYAYYKYRPPAHNLTSEWNFLYNKAHNEFLNFMATTGTFGILTYLSIYLFFFLIIGASVFDTISKTARPLLSRIRASEFPEYETNHVLIFALTASFISILITNFFGFSVVITNIYLFLIPAFCFVLLGVIDWNYSIGRKSEVADSNVSTLRWAGVMLAAVPTVLILLFLYNSWQADQKYALGQNLDRAGQYQQAYPLLHQAVAQRGDEPVFKDELSVNDAILATALITQTDQKNKDQSQALAESLAQEAIATSNKLTQDYPNNLIFWKSKVRIYYTLAQLNSSYLPLALNAVQKAAELAPTEASIQYNLGVITGQNGDSKKAVEILKRTVMLKPNYADAQYALGLFYHDLSVDKNGKTINSDFQFKAINQMKIVLEIEPNYQKAKDSLASWTK